jgi:uncharacterized protein (DUF1330 family)
MPKGYWIVRIDVRDPEVYQHYVKANGAAFAKYGARFLVRGGKHLVTRGKARERNVVIEFRTMRPPSPAMIPRNIEQPRSFATPRATPIS